MAVGDGAAASADYILESGGSSGAGTCSGKHGRTIIDVDLENLSGDGFEILHRAWLDHDGVLRIPGQFVAAETLLALSALIAGAT